MTTRHLLRVSHRPSRYVPMPDWVPQIPAIGQLLAEGWDVPAGVTMLIGENGSGKSTLVNSLSGNQGPDQQKPPIRPRHTG